MKKYIYTYDDKRGYYIEPKNSDVLKILPKRSLKSAKKDSIVKVSLKKRSIFVVKEIELSLDLSDRKVDSSYEIYEIELSEIDEFLNELNIKKEITNFSEIFYLIKNFNEKNYKFSDDYLPFLFIKLFFNQLDEICFEKELYLNFKLTELEECLKNYLNEDVILSYYNFVNKNKLDANIVKCLSFNNVINYIDDECKKEILELADRNNIFDKIKIYIFDYNCIALKRKFLEHFIKIADDGQVERLYKSTKKKFLVIGI